MDKQETIRKILEAAANDDLKAAERALDQYYKDRQKYELAKWITTPDDGGEAPVMVLQA